jgi:hypothetical protein
MRGLSQQDRVFPAAPLRSAEGQLVTLGQLRMAEMCQWHDAASLFLRHVVLHASSSVCCFQGWSLPFEEVSKMVTPGEVQQAGLWGLVASFVPTL